MDNDLDISSSYVSYFRVHLARVKAHLAGETEDALSSSGCWTSSEKNAFFHALARCSRLRPDLIAAHIKTKSVVDVLAYIDQLETASKANPISWTRKDTDIAFEVSDSWVEFEEQNASSMAAAESIWDDEQCKTSRQANIVERHADTPDTFDNWRQEAEAQWNREDALKRLDALQLSVLESILRAGDSLSSSAPVEDMGHYSSNASRETHLDPDPTVVGALQNANIEPRGDHMQPAAQTFQTTTNQTSTRSEQVLSSTAPRDGLTPDNPTSQVPPGALDSTSRQRLRKRLYMRRKRAEQSGREVNFAVTKLKPGRETRDRMKIPRPKKYNTKKDKEKPAGLHSDLGHERSKKHSVGGMTKFYKIRQQFAQQQIDLAALQRTGLDLFRLSILSRLIELYKSGYGEAGVHVITSISADIICLLRSIAIDFVTEVMHRAIVFKNQDLQRKSETKAWRLGQKEISLEVIQSCLEMMGLENLTKEAYFERLLGGQSDSDPSSTDGSEAEESKATDHSVVNKSSSHVPMANQYSLVSVLTERDMQDTTFLSAIEEYRDNTSIMREDVDVNGELEEEEELDQLDKMLMQQNEVELWKEVT